MSVKIRLTRIGRHEDPIYRVVVSDSRNARDGKFIEQIGQYNPALGFSSFVIDEEKAVAWLKKGAQPSDTIKALLTSKGLIAKSAPVAAKKEKKAASKKVEPKEGK
jgi:small subunit ribosomal protein S16